MKPILLLLFFVSGWVFAQPFDLSDVVQNPRFNVKPQYFSLDLAYTPVANVRQALEAQLCEQLLNRGEAHITVFTPQEFAELSKKVSGKEILDLATQLSVQIQPLCVGQGELVINGKTEKTYFIVVQSSELVELRRQVADLYWTRGGRSQQFAPDHYYPHITLGFTKRDLHQQDGVIKDIKSCF